MCNVCTKKDENKTAEGRTTVHLDTPFKGIDDCKGYTSDLAHTCARGVMGGAQSGAAGGTFISYEAGTRKGEWVGKYVHANGDVMEGSVKKGMLYGKGKYVFKNGDVYIGEFRASKFEGKGKYIYKRSGDVYDGEWRYDQMHGKGKYTYANGDIYLGMWKDGRADGQGTQVYSNGDRYSGAWVADQQTGRGSYEYANGDLYVGELFEGKHDGSGSYKFAETGEYQVSVTAADADVGTGARWSRDTASAYKLVRGKPTVQISLQEARRIAAAVGEPIPEAPIEEQVSKALRRTTISERLPLCREAFPLALPLVVCTLAS